jgi:hypothetical protein
MVVKNEALIKIYDQETRGKLEYAREIVKIYYDVC